eukprot:14671173-Ditylum_brightwellii.AAC.1
MTTRKDAMTTENNIGGSSGGAMGDLVKFVKQQHSTHDSKNEPCSGIVYVHKREDTARLALQITR